MVVDAFLGRIQDPVPTESAAGTVEILRDPAFRAIMFTDLKDSTAMTTRLGDAKALHLLHIHNAMTRNALRDHNGREVKHTAMDSWSPLLLFLMQYGVLLVSRRLLRLITKQILIQLCMYELA